MVSQNVVARCFVTMVAAISILPLPGLAFPQSTRDIAGVNSGIVDEEAVQVNPLPLSKRGKPG